MKLAAKLTGLTILAILVVFAVRGYQGARREIATAEVDAREDQVLIGRALHPALVAVWQKDGRDRTAGGSHHCFWGRGVARSRPVERRRRHAG